MSFDVGQIGEEMLAAAAAVFKKKWPKIKEYADEELKNFARVLERISARYAARRITEENARAMVRAQVRSMKIVFLAVEGMNKLMVESAINAAIDVVRTVVNEAIGFALL